MSFRNLSCFLKNTNPIMSRILRVQRRTMNTVKESEVKNDPIKYSTSKAGQWKAVYSTSGRDYYNSPRSESFITMISLASFLIYFCILREENDLDEWLRNIETEIPYKIEEGQLRGQIEHGKRNKLDVSSYEKRLKAIKELQEKVKVASEVR